MAEEKTIEKITVVEAIGFWQKNKSWLVPAIAAIGGLIGGSNVDKAMPYLPGTSDIIKRLDADEARLGVVEARLGVVPPSTDTKKNDGSQGDGVIHVN